MPVDQTSYRGWTGKARATHLVIFAIAGTMIRRLFRLRLVRYTAVGFPLAATLIASLVFSLVHEGEMGFSRFMRRGMFSADDVLPLMNRFVHANVGFFALLLAALVGAPLIAEDRRAHALPLYFSRPLTHFDYLAGKLLTLFFFLGLLFLLPPVSMYLLDVGYSDVDGIAWTRLPLLLRSLVPAAALVVTYSAVALGASALCRRTNYAALLFFGVMMMAIVMAKLLSHQIFGDADWQAVSPWLAGRRIAMEMLPVPPHLDRGDPMLPDMAVGAAWKSLGLWTAAGLGVVIAKVRRVEVVA